MSLDVWGQSMNTALTIDHAKRFRRRGFERFFVLAATFHLQVQLVGHFATRPALFFQTLLVQHCQRNTQKQIFKKFHSSEIIIETVRLRV